VPVPKQLENREIDRQIDLIIDSAEHHLKSLTAHEASSYR
jgi:hypothetical protein